MTTDKSHVERHPAHKAWLKTPESPCLTEQAVRNEVGFVGRATPVTAYSADRVRFQEKLRRSRDTLGRLLNQCVIA